MAPNNARHRFELSRLELAGLVVSAAATLFVVFLLGVYAGRGLDEGRLAANEHVVRRAVDDQPVPEPEEDRLTFDDTLAGVPQPERRADAPAAAAEQRAEPGVPSAANVVAAGRDDPSEPAAALRDADKAAAEKREAERPAAAAAAARDTGASTDDDDEADTEASGAPAVAAAAPPRKPAAGASPTPAPGRVAVAREPAARGDWSVQVMATRDPRTADDMLRRLKGKGYDAYLQKTRREGQTFYRVRVGHYDSMDRANQAVARLKREPGVQAAFVASD
jgi:septal ring-binding cell division protein DamX